MITTALLALSILLPPVPPASLPGRLPPPASLPGRLPPPASLPGRLPPPASLPGRLPPPASLPGRLPPPPLTEHPAGPDPLAEPPPFRHGVASGDPLDDRVVIWTRLSGRSNERVTLDWSVATDPDMRQIVRQGNVVTGAERDFTVKVDVDGLESGRTYFYRFSFEGEQSPVGRTRTLSVGSVDTLRLVAASCANYQQGYFNAYSRIADRQDLDLVLFLGDYLYEEGPDDVGYRVPKSRRHIPPRTLRTLDEYRQRYGQYRSDTALMRLHRTHPFVAIWDDHEVSDDCHAAGGLVHDDEVDGPWIDRRRAAVRAYFEWMPVREFGGEEGRVRLYRTMQFGDLAELTLIDTRLDGRSEQARNRFDDALDDPEHRLLGDRQREWFFERLRSRSTPWQLVGNQVMITPLRLVGNMDAWDGYPIERDRVLRQVERLGVENLLFITGDIHVSFAAEIARNPFDRSHYDPSSGRGSLGVEVTTPSISSANFNEVHRLPPGSLAAELLTRFFRGVNPHVRLADLDRHGYLHIELTRKRAVASWWYVNPKRGTSGSEVLGFRRVIAGNRIVR